MAGWRSRGIGGVVKREEGPSGPVCETNGHGWERDEVLIEVEEEGEEEGED